VTHKLVCAYVQAHVHVSMPCTSIRAVCVCNASCMYCVCAYLHVCVCVCVFVYINDAYVYMYMQHMQNGNTALELAKNAATFECLREAGAKMPDITDENKNVLLLRYARNGAAHLLRAVLQAGANADHTDEVRVLRVISDGMPVRVRNCSTCLCTVYLVHPYVRSDHAMYMRYACAIPRCS
jgi:hypothetical protein